MIMLAGAASRHGRGRAGAALRAAAHAPSTAGSDGGALPQQDAHPGAATRAWQPTTAAYTNISSSSSSSSSYANSSTWAISSSAGGSRAFSSGGRRPVVAVALSGGVDSAVAALLLRRAGLEAFGVYMHNWDAGDEAGGSGAGVCTSERDLRDAQAVAAKLRLPLLEADFVGRYWGDVFSGFLSGVAAGVTPNPDLTCNAAIKFGALWEFAAAAGADVLATGHYARLGRPAAGGGPQAEAAASGGSGGGGGPQADTGGGGGGQLLASSCYGAVEVLGPFEPWAASGGGGSDHGGGAAGGSGPLLLRGADPAKDQSYFLAGVSGRQLARALFPVGHMRKAEVRALAAAEGLRPADKRSSAGICFIGRRRSFGSFLEQYVPPLPGRYVDAGSGTDLGPCANLLALTPGQRAPLGGGGARRYIAGKDLAARLAFVASGHDHPALRARRALLMPARWVGGGAPPGLLGGGGSAAVDSDGWRQPGLPCSCQARYRQADAACIVQAAGGDGWRPGDGSGGTRFEQSRFAGGSIESAVAAVAASAAAPATASSGGAGGGSFGVGDGPFLRLSLAEPLRGLAPGQAVVMYDGPVVLGSALLAAPGPTLAEEAGGG